MDSLDLSPEPERAEPMEDDREASPMLILLGILFVASALTVMISYVKGHDFLFVLSGIFAPVFMGCFVLEYFGDVHFVFGNDCDPASVPEYGPAPEYDPEPTAAELRAWADAIDRSNNIIPPHHLNRTRVWTCSYCGVTNVWKEEHQGAVCCTHCGAKYENDELKTL